MKGNDFAYGALSVFGDTLLSGAMEAQGDASLTKCSIHTVDVSNSGGVTIRNESSNNDVVQVVNNGIVLDYGNLIVGGQITVDGTHNLNPLFCAGKMDGYNMQSMSSSSVGRTGLTISRASGISTCV